MCIKSQFKQTTINSFCVDIKFLYRLENYNRPIFALLDCSIIFKPSVLRLKFTKQFGLFCKYKSYYNKELQV